MKFHVQNFIALPSQCSILISQIGLAQINFTISNTEDYNSISMSRAQKSLTAAQIQYLKIGPKGSSSEEFKKILRQAIKQEKQKQFATDVTNLGSLNKIPKMTYGEFEKTVTNFGVMINKNFGNETSVHQQQKFGKMAVSINRTMIQEKDKPIYNEKKNALLKKIKDRSDNRTCIKVVHDFQGEKLSATLKSFAIESSNANQGGLPIPYLRFLLNHVNTSRLVKIIEPAMKNEGNQIVVEFDKIESRASHLANSQSKYQNAHLTFERLGQTLEIMLPCVEFHHAESQFEQKVQIMNKQILEIIDCNFENVGDIVEKYLDCSGFEQALRVMRNQNGKNERTSGQHSSND